MQSTPSKTIGIIIRWTARVVGTLMVALFVIFFVGESLIAGEPFPIFQLTTEETLESLAVVVMSIGALIAWRWELLGGWLCIGGGLLFNGVESIGDRAVSILWFPTVFVIVGVLFVLHERRERSAPSPP